MLRQHIRSLGPSLLLLCDLGSFWPVPVLCEGEAPPNADLESGAAVRVVDKRLQFLDYGF